VSRQEDNLLTGLHHTLLNTASKDITNTLDLVDTRNRHAHWRADGPLRNTADNVQDVEDCVNMNVFLANKDIHTLPPIHVGGLLQKVVAHPARDWEHWGVFLNEIFLPTNLDQHACHLL